MTRRDKNSYVLSFFGSDNADLKPNFCALQIGLTDQVEKELLKGFVQKVLGSESASDVADMLHSGEVFRFGKFTRDAAETKAKEINDFAINLGYAVSCEVVKLS